MGTTILRTAFTRIMHGRCFSLGLASLLIFLGAQSQLKAETLDVSSLYGYIYQVDTTTGSITTLVNTHGPAVDSLISAPKENSIVFSLPNNGEIGIFNTVTNSTRYVFSPYGFDSEPVDIALEPGGTSVLVSDANILQVARIDLTAAYPNFSYLSNWLDDIDGITYDPAGDLFVVRSWDGYVAKISPLDASISRQLRCPGCSFYGGDQLDGMTYDPYSGELWVSNIMWGGITEFNTALTSTNNYAVGKILDPDGIQADGNGNIFVASKLTDHIYDYNEITGTTTELNPYIPGLDDIMPLTGLGAPSPPTATTPEPGTLLMVCMGLIGLAGTLKGKMFA